MFQPEVAAYLLEDQVVVGALEILHVLRYSSSFELRRYFVRTHRLELEFLTTRRAITRLGWIGVLVFSFR